MTVRTFISIHVSDSSGLSEVVNRLKKVRNIRVPRMDKIHLTLCFIGDLDEKYLKDVYAAVDDATSGLSSFTSKLIGVGAFPNPDRPRVVWVGVNSENVLEYLSDKIKSNLTEHGIEFDDKPFKAHITVGRVSGPTRITDVIEEYNNKLIGPFSCNSVCVMKSELNPEGSKYTILHKSNFN